MVVRKEQRKMKNESLPGLEATETLNNKLLQTQQTHYQALT